MGTPVYDPVAAGNSLITAPWKKNIKQGRLLEKMHKYRNKI